MKIFRIYINKRCFKYLVKDRADKAVEQFKKESDHEYNYRKT